MFLHISNSQVFTEIFACHYQYFIRFASLLKFFFMFFFLKSGMDFATLLISVAVIKETLDLSSFQFMSPISPFFSNVQNVHFLVLLRLQVLGL